ncbi:MAG: sigma-70 family RNA polymerase sigma factor [Planctomycetes bacterium]|nr:sigma-70 family RNA polymerase sigma factor [Planctomycetota bacterium]
MPPEPADVTRLLQRAGTGDPAAASQLFEQLYADLRARAQLVNQQANSTLQPTALVHEAWLRLVPNRRSPFADRNHFLRAAARAMRSVLVDHVRARKSQKRGGDLARVELDHVAGVYDARAVDLLVIDDAMQRLTDLDPELAQIVELRFFAGLQMQEVADVMGASLSTVERGWRTASAFLRAELTDR